MRFLNDFRFTHARTQTRTRWWLIGFIHAHTYAAYGEACIRQVGIDGTLPAFGAAPSAKLSSKLSSGGREAIVVVVRLAARKNGAVKARQGVLVVSRAGVFDVGKATSYWSANHRASGNTGAF